jgi:hypothetical protein
VDALRRPSKGVMRLLTDIFPPNYENCYEFFSAELVSPADIALSAVPSARNSLSAGGGTINVGEIPGFQPPGPVAPVAGDVPAAPKRARRQKVDSPAGSIMAICSEALQREGTTAYQALKNAKLIGNLTEIVFEDASRGDHPPENGV